MPRRPPELDDEPLDDQPSGGEKRRDGTTQPHRDTEPDDQPSGGGKRRGGDTQPHPDTEPDGNTQAAIERQRGVNGPGLDDLSAPRGADDPPEDWPADLARPVGEEPLDGGYIGRTTRTTLADGRTVVVKRCPYPAQQEADGLRALGAAGAPVPAVLGVGGHILVLEYVAGDPDWSLLGRAVARLHRHTAARFGWPIVNYHGRFPQDNTWSDSWPDFYVQRRVAPQLARADLPADLRARIETACAGPLPALLRPDPPASLTHGDLWPGNMIDGRWLVDPAVSYADRELDLAYLSLSNDLPPEFMIAYRDEYPVEPDFEERRPALLLHKYLVNVRHFGDRALPRLWTLLEHYGW